MARDPARAGRLRVHRRTGADPDDIGWQYRGIQPSITPTASSSFTTPCTMPPRGSRPSSPPHLPSNGTKTATLDEVPCLPRRRRTVRFRWAPTTGAALVIDPEITFSTFAGSTGDNFGTTASNGPGRRPDRRARSPSPWLSHHRGRHPDRHGRLRRRHQPHRGHRLQCGRHGALYSTYIGGSRADIPHSLAYNETWGQVALLGTTGSNDFPTTAGTFQPDFNIGGAVTISIYGNDVQLAGLDCYLLTLDGADYTLNASTYFGGTGATDSMRAWSSGPTSATSTAAKWTSDPRAASGSPPPRPRRTFHCRAAPPTPADRTRLWPGSARPLDPAQWTHLRRVLGRCGLQHRGRARQQFRGARQPPGTRRRRHPVGRPALAARIHPTQSGRATEGWIVQFNASPDDLTAQFGTYHGLEDYDQVYFVQRDGSGRPYAYGQAKTGMPVIGDVYANPGSGQYITCFLPDMSDIEWQTVVGTGAGTIDLSPTAFLVSDCEQVYISGWGGETNATGGTGEVAGSTTFGLPTTDSPFQAGTDGSDFYLAVLVPQRGGPRLRHVLRRTLRQRARRRRFLAVRPERNSLPGRLRGLRRHERFPLDAGRLEPQQPLAQLQHGGLQIRVRQAQRPDLTSTAPTTCQGESVQFENSTAGPAAFTWDFGDANFSNEVALHLYGLNGVFDVEVIAQDTTGMPGTRHRLRHRHHCPNADPQVPPVDALCLGESVQLDGSGNGELSWFPATGLSSDDIPNPVAEPNSTITYTLTDVTLCGTESTDVTVEVVDMQTEINGDTQICLGDGAPLAVTSPQSEATGWDYDWQPINWLSDPGAPDPVASPVETTTYSVTVTTPEGCERFHDVTVSVVPGAPGDSLYPTVPLCIGQSVQSVASRRGQHLGVVPTTGLNNPASQTPFATPQETTTYTVTISNLCGEGTDEVTVELIVPEAFVEPGGRSVPGSRSPYPVAASPINGFPAALATNPTAAQTTVVTETSQTFTAYVTDADGCVASAEVDVLVWPRPTVEAGPDQRQEWLEPTFLYGSVDGSPIDSLWWSPAEPLSCDDCLIPEVSCKRTASSPCTSSTPTDVGPRTSSKSSSSTPSTCPPPSRPMAMASTTDGGRRGQWLNGTGTYISKGFPTRPSCQATASKSGTVGANASGPRKIPAPTGPAGSVDRERRPEQAASGPAATSSCPASTPG